MARKILIVSLLLLTAIMSVMAQDRQQAKLLRKAYALHSTKMLYAFFDNWSEEVQSNEQDAKNPYVVEAHKVFAAFYQPLQTYNYLKKNQRFTLYDEKQYFIVQGSLFKIEVAECIPREPAEIDSFMVNRIWQVYEDYDRRNKWLERYQQESFMPCYESYRSVPIHTIVPLTTVDSAVTFHPPVHFDGKIVVYLTNGYKELLDSFLGNCYVELGKRNIMQAAFSKGRSRMKQKFFNKAALIYYGHWGGYWEYVTFPEAYRIVFNPEMNRAMVFFRFIYRGGDVYMEKKDGEWTVVDFRFTWIE